TNDLINTFKHDAGLKPTSYYKQNLTSLRFQIREFLIYYIKLETPYLSKIQNLLRCKIFDFYFSYTANLGSHTFYVLLLPIPGWFGSLITFRDLVLVLGLGIYLTGFIKDYLCLPRPKSPPLHRITLSHYTSKEYGCPSSHTANATGVSLIFLKLLINSDLSIWKFIGLLSLLNLYYISLVFGRIYCGMHGFIDILIGSIIGIFIFLLRLITTDIWDSFIMSNSKIVPIVVIVIYYTLIYNHSKPIDNCPCFDDSVAFIGVLIGLDLSHWSLTNIRNDPVNLGLISYDFNKLGLLKSILRVILGVTMIILWKSISKKLLFKLYNPLYSRIFINNKHADKHADCGALKNRYDLDIIIRLSVYSGIAIIAV
ncbi:hypothetical protein CANARDRAFT_180293, partial [[Candida] arabinofermentans NRRL YB-2248]